MYRKRVIVALCFSSIALWLTCSYLLASFLSETQPTPRKPTKPGTSFGLKGRGVAVSTNKPVELHILYNVGCGGKSYPAEYQLLQALALEQTWSEVGQRGNLTRIVSGCTSSQLMRRTSLTKQHDIERHTVWFTPANDTLPNGKRYVMFNRPNALLKFLSLHGRDNVVYAVLDPDFIFLQQIPERVINNVKKGQTISAGYYGLGFGKWTDWGHEICMKHLWKSKEKCDAYHALPRRVVRTKYEAGAPYFMYASDWTRLIKTWIQVIPFTFEYYNGIESDMFSYMIACVHEGLSHYLDQDLMRTCMRSVDRPSEVPLTNDIFIHYCQRYHVFETRKDKKYLVSFAKEFLEEAELKSADFEHVYTFSKYWTQARGRQTWLVECETPYLLLPPEPEEHLWAAYTSEMQFHYNVLNALVPAFNRALYAYKGKYCDGIKPDPSKRLILQEAHSFNNYKLNQVISIP